MNPFIISLLSAVSAFAFVHLADGPQWLKAIYGFIVKEGDAGKLKSMHIKPLDCHTCLAFWLMLITGLINGVYLLSVPLAFLAMVIAQLLYVLFKRVLA